MSINFPRYKINNTCCKDFPYSKCELCGEVACEVCDARVNDSCNNLVALIQNNGYHSMSFIVKRLFNWL